MAHDLARHAVPAGHTISCGVARVGSVEVSEIGGLGRIEKHDDLIAALQRDEGIVALVDVKNPSRPRKIGEWGNDAQQSLDGDVAFSDDGQWLFYARQTVQFSQDGIHVLDISDPTAPVEASYQPQGGTFRVVYYKTGADEYVITLDATAGLVINRFIRPAGILVPVSIDALPALKVGGPASAGLFIDPDDPHFGVPTLYVTTGQTGLQIFDMSEPAAPQAIATDLGSSTGLAEVEVAGGARDRTVYLAPEYWFVKNLEPQIEVVDLNEPGETPRRIGVTKLADDLWRVQGMAVSNGYLYVAHSHAGLAIFDAKGVLVGVDQRFGARNEASRVAPGTPGAVPYVFDVEVDGELVYVSDAATGTLTILRHNP